MKVSESSSSHPSVLGLAAYFSMLVSQRSWMRTLVAALAALGAATAQTVDHFPVPAGSHPHDVAPAADGDGVWFTAQRSGHLGFLDPDTGEVRLVPLGQGSRPHGVIVGPDGAAWVTDGVLNAIVRFDPSTESFEAFPSDRPGVAVRQLHGRPGEVWGAESGTDRLVRIRTR